MPSVIVVGGGLAGLAAAAALGQDGFDVTLFESRPFLGGRATSYPVGGPDGESETIDNCQHVLLRCCVNLIDFYKRLGVDGQVQFHREFFFIEPGGRVSILKSGILPSPAHFSGAFLKMHCLSLADKVGIARALLALRSEFGRRADLDQLTMLDWLREKKQTKRAIQRFWNQVLVSAINEDLDRMAAAHGFQVFWLGFLANSSSYEMGVPAVPLGDLYSADAWRRLPNVKMMFRQAVESVEVRDNEVVGVRAAEQLHQADYYVTAVPFERIGQLAPELGIDLSGFEHSPITGIHLWFDRPVTNLPHATLLDRTIQWMFNKRDGRYLQLVISASRSLTPMSRTEILDMAVKEIREFFPEAREAKLERAHVVKEVRATFSASPGLEGKRPAAQTRYRQLFLAGDWTRSGWPATMEGAVRSGYLAAEAVAATAGTGGRYLVPDIA